jgi:hypothetical protein
MTSAGQSEVLEEKTRRRDADSVVPPQENAGAVTERYRALGGKVEFICQPTIGHRNTTLGADRGDGGRAIFAGKNGTGADLCPTADAAG